MAKARQSFPGWASRWLKGLGYRPGNVMDPHVRRWWGWYDASDEWYEDRSEARPRRMTLRPAKAVCDEYEFLMLDGDTQVTSPDAAANKWISERFGDLVPSLAGFVSRYMAEGTGGLAVDLSGVSAAPGAASAGAEARVRTYGALDLAPLLSDGDECVSCAFVARVAVGGAEYDQLQVHEPGDGGLYRIRTWLFDVRNHRAPVEADGVIPEVLTGSPAPTFALARPAVANVYEEHTPLGASVYADACDAVRAVDEAFDQYYWAGELCRARLFCSEQALVVDPKTGRPSFRSTVDAMLYNPINTPASQDDTLLVYNPDMRLEQLKGSVSLALSVLGWKTGFGAAYFSLDGAQIQGGYKTAKEVVAGNARLMRTVRKHEQLLGDAISRVLAGAWCAESALRSGSPASEAPEIEVAWDDSIMEDTETERQTMKDDIARGLCPAYLYPMAYYGMDEAAARELTGETAAGRVPEEL